MPGDRLRRTRWLPLLLLGSVALPGAPAWSQPPPTSGAQEQEAKISVRVDLVNVDVTVTDARGKGSRGRRQSDWSQEGNIRIEMVCEPALAERVARHLRERYYDHYAMILFLQDVSVLRPDKF